MTGQAAFDKPVRPAALCSVGAVRKKEVEPCEEHDGMSDGEGDGMEDEEVFAEEDPGTSRRRGREKSAKQRTCPSKTGAHIA